MSKTVVKQNVGSKAKSGDSLTIGIDLGDRWGHYCVLDAEGEVVEEGRLRMTRSAFTAHFLVHEPALLLKREHTQLGSANTCPPWGTK